MPRSIGEWFRSRSRKPTPAHRSYQVTIDDVATLLENFAGYVNPAGEHDPWFTLGEINQQFAWSDVPDGDLLDWLGQLYDDGRLATEIQADGRVWRWVG